MLEVYVLVEKKKSVILKLLTYVVLGLLIVCIWAALFIVPLYMTFALIFGVLWYLLQFCTNKEFEYSYFDGEARFAKIMNKSRRKRLGVYSMDEVVQIAPAGDRSVYKYENDRSVKVLDYSSRKSDAVCYDMVVNDGGRMLLIRFEPDEKYLDAACIKYSQKIVRR